MRYLLLLAVAYTFQAQALSTNSCEMYLQNPAYAKAITQVASNMGYTYEQLCAVPRLMDIFVENRNLLNEQQEIIPHILVTLHYGEESCQYFVRDSDFVVTKKNCYNTF